MAWIPLRELLLGLVHTPALLLPLAAVLGLALAWWLQKPRSGAAALALLLPMALSAIYPPRHCPAQCLAAAQLRRDPSLSAYVSGDAPSPIAGDSCARTTWENATLTAAWLGQHHPGVPVLLITDPWQLPRAAHAFARQGLQVQPLAAEPQLSATERNRLALRETAATLLYRLQGRM